MGYLVETSEDGITYGGPLKTPMGMEEPPPHFAESRGVYAVHDSSWNKAPKPYAGHGVYRCNGLIGYKAHLVKVVADSTMEAETAEASAAVKTVMYVQLASRGVKRPVLAPTATIGDNEAMYSTRRW